MDEDLPEEMIERAAVIELSMRMNGWAVLETEVWGVVPEGSDSWDGSERFDLRMALRSTGFQRLPIFPKMPNEWQGCLRAKS